LRETEDQEAAISDVIEDLASGRPMDRLVCGDVGFGKTEVALRAAFVAAMAGQQVAVVAPTTLLARQHHKGFTDRCGSRWRGAASRASCRQRRLLCGAGGWRSILWSAPTLWPNVKFKERLVMDEEQRFGVNHKERLKQLRADVHMLTLTATPIPRTLQMAMSGLRELSTIQTPPVDRLACAPM
jgi:transcription-repair coupling factor (superfamily II helicase)